MTQPSLAIVGLGTMGANLARNFAAKGQSLVVTDEDADAARRVAAELGAVAAADAAALAAALPTPRAVLMMVPAGEATDAALAALAPHLAGGDIVIDGGNSHYADTDRRAAECARAGIRLLGFGISGGAEGARTGPAIMAGGDADAVAQVRPAFEAIAARFGDEPCFAYAGPGGAGHFVKTVHNGIEYAQMQLLAEAYHLLRSLLAMPQHRVRAAFAGWARGPIASYLIDCALLALDRKDAETGKPLLAVIADTAGQKGTGAWAANAALEFGVPAPTIAEAVHARCMSALRPERTGVESAFGRIQRAYAGEVQIDAYPDVLEQALAAASIAVHAQGFALLAGAAGRGWASDRAAIARGWRAGCIIRSRLLDDVAKVLAETPDLPNLLRNAYFRQVIVKTEAALRTVAIQGVAHRVPLPAFGSAIAYVDAYYTGRLWSNLTAAQRDAFGAHGFERLDKPGRHHADWSQP